MIAVDFFLDVRMPSALTHSNITLGQVYFTYILFKRRFTYVDPKNLKNHSHLYLHLLLLLLVAYVIMTYIFTDFV